MTVQEPQGMQPTYVVLARYSGVEDTKGARPSWQPNRNHHHQYYQADVDQTMLPRQPLLHATSVDDVLSAMMCRPTAPPQRGSHVTKALGRELRTKNTYLTKRANKKGPIISSTLFNLLNYQVPYLIYSTTSLFRLPSPYHMKSKHMTYDLGISNR